jgi:uncharacterized protein (DUF2236 family)
VAVISHHELDAALGALARDVRDPREGILGPRSVAWRLGGDLGVFLGGGRAALLQLAHPMVAYAVDHHSRTRADVVGRFQRTFRNVFAMVFGDLDDAFTAARRVHAIHTRIHGKIPHAIGRWPAGALYHANDADALRWVHATLVDTTLVVRELLGGELPVTIKDAYVIEMNRFGKLFAIPDDRLPRTWREHADYMAAMFASDALGVAPVAREMAAFLLGRAPGQAQPALGRLAQALTATMLPPHLARGFGIERSRRSVAALRRALRGVGLVYNRVPPAVAGIPARSEALRRIAGKPPSPIAAWAERQLFGLSRQVVGR